MLYDNNFAGNLGMFSLVIKHSLIQSFFSFFFYAFLMEDLVMSVLDNIQNREKWLEFLDYKRINRHLSKTEDEKIEQFIVNERYIYYYNCICSNKFPLGFPVKKVINKEGTEKKRIVYSYDEEENIILKFIAHQLYVFDAFFSKSCYSFRRKYGASDAIRHFRKNRQYALKYCFKADISNYFNSMDIDLLMEKLEFLKSTDRRLYEMFERILREERVIENGTVIRDNHGAMAGTPVSPFFANVYLNDVDRWFEDKKIEYFRYSDDILIFADSETELNDIISHFYVIINEHKLVINNEKASISKPGEIWEFLGISYDFGKIDLSHNTKIKIKADSLRRWKRRKNLPPNKAAIGFIKAMNYKFYGVEDSDDFTWSRWFFPIITEDKGLKEIDAYMQEYIRYVVTGRHYKGNYRITYDMIKEWGYISLVNEYYSFRAFMNNKIL